MKRFAAGLFLVVGVLPFLPAQASITRFAVVDMNRVFTVFSEQSADAKAFNEKRDRIQADIERMTKELQELNAKLEEAKANEKRDQIRNLENQVRTKTQTVQNYINTSFADLEKDREKLAKNEAFMTQLTNILRLVAESEGYSAVLSRQDSGILWSSPSVDITNKVIERIRSGNTRR